MTDMKDWYGLKYYGCDQKDAVGDESASCDPMLPFLVHAKTFQQRYGCGARSLCFKF